MRRSLAFPAVLVCLIAGCSGPGKLSLQDVELPDTTVGVTYLHQLTATGGTAPLSWSCTGLPAGLSLSAGGLLSGMATSAGTSSLSVTVTDKAGVVAQKSYPLQVYPQLAVSTDSLPIAVASSAYSVTLSAQGGRAPLTWTVSSGTLAPGLSLSPAGVLSGTPGASGKFGFTVQAVDANGGSDSRALALAVEPALTLTAGQLPSGNVGSPYSVTLQASGGQSPLGFSLASGSLPAGLLLSSSGSLSGTPTAAGSSSFRVTVTDAGGLAVSGDMLLRVWGNPPPRITTTALPTAVTGSPYSASLAATGGALPYTWTLVAGPAGVTLSSNGSLGGTLSTTGSFPIQVSLADANLQSASASLNLIVAPLLQVTPFTLADAYESSPYSLTVTATGGVPPLSWNLTPPPLPPGMGFSGNVFSGTPTMPGLYPDAVQVGDSLGQVVSLGFPFHVYARPKLATAALGDGSVGAAYSQTLAGINGKLPYAFSVTAGTLPPGLTLAASGGLSGTPTTAGTSSFTVQLSDANGWTSTQVYSITIYSGLAVDTGALPDGYTGSSYNQSLGAAGGNAPYSWTQVGGSLPAGLTLSPSGSLGGTPGAAGTYSFDVQVTDSSTPTAQTRIKTLSLNIDTPPSIDNASLPDAYTGSPYTVTLSASGGRPPFHFGDHVLPDSLAVVDSGLLIGTPPAADNGTSFTLVVTDTNGVTASKALSITTYDPVAITTSSVPSGQLSTSYNWTLTASGGKAPLTWTVSSGNPPPGLTLSSGGLLSGAPKVVGSWTFTVQVMDANGRTDSLALTIPVTK